MRQSNMHAPPWPRMGVGMSRCMECLEFICECDDERCDRERGQREQDDSMFTSWKTSEPDEVERAFRDDCHWDHKPVYGAGLMEYEIRLGVYRKGHAYGKREERERMLAEVEKSYGRGPRGKYIAAAILEGEK